MIESGPGTFRGRFYASNAVEVEWIRLPQTERQAELRFECGVWYEIKPSSLREESVMSLRTIVSIAALVIIGIASVPTDTFARVPAGTTRLHHHQHHASQTRHYGLQNDVGR